jgi:hypothetical protein
MTTGDKGVTANLRDVKNGDDYGDGDGDGMEHQTNAGWLPMW